MHNIIATEGIVLRKRGVGEANTLVALLTKDLGLIRASARSARVAKSKLRYGLEPLVHGRFSLIKGKHEWKVTGVDVFAGTLRMDSPARRAAAGRVARLLLRLIQGEEAVSELYATVAEGFAHLARAVGKKDADTIECLLVLRILSHLGYLPKTPEIKPFLEQDFFSLELAAQARASRTLLIKAINESLDATGL